MNYIRKGIRIIDDLVNWLIVLCFVPLLLYGFYALWDTAQVNHRADSTIYETYRPTKDDSLSFNQLRELNPEVFGWLCVYGTNINYPLVQGDDNSKYVNTDVEGNFALSGSIFLDYNNAKNFTDINTVIYGHHMDKEVMFGEIEFFSQPEYFDQHHYGSVYYENEWHGIEFFAFLHVDAYDPVIYDIGLKGDEDRRKYQAYVKEYAMNYRDISLQAEDYYVALSTCTSSSTNGRHVLVGRLTETPQPNLFDSN